MLIILLPKERIICEQWRACWLQTGAMIWFALQKSMNWLRCWGVSFNMTSICKLYGNYIAMRFSKKNAENGSPSFYFWNIVRLRSNPRYQHVCYIWGCIGYIGLWWSWERGRKMAENVCEQTNNNIKTDKEKRNDYKRKTS